MAEAPVAFAGSLALGALGLILWKWFGLWDVTDIGNPNGTGCEALLDGFV
ncbi:hypothetical protein GCM10008940_14490 [Microbulbifer agarilyticus]